MVLVLVLAISSFPSPLLQTGSDVTESIWSKQTDLAPTYNDFFFLMGPLAFSKAEFL